MPCVVTTQSTKMTNVENVKKMQLMVRDRHECMTTNDISYVWKLTLTTRIDETIQVERKPSSRLTITISI